MCKEIFPLSMLLFLNFLKQIFSLYGNFFFEVQFQGWLLPGTARKGRVLRRGRGRKDKGVLSVSSYIIVG